MATKKIMCPYCKYLYNHVYGSRKDKQKFEQIASECSELLKEHRRLYYYQQEPLADKKAQEETKINIPEFDDYTNGIFVRESIELFLHSEEKLFMRYKISEKLRDFYKKANVKLDKIDCYEYFNVMFNLLIIMGSIAVYRGNIHRTRTTEVDLVIIDNPDNISKVYANKYPIDYTQLDKEREKCIKKIQSKFCRNPVKYQMDFLNSTKELALNIQANYFLKMLHATAVAAQELKLLEV